MTTASPPFVDPVEGCTSSMRTDESVGGSTTGISSKAGRAGVSWSLSGLAIGTTSTVADGAAVLGSDD
jgi:hypothetical protein